LLGTGENRTVLPGSDLRRAPDLLRTPGFAQQDYLRIAAVPGSALVVPGYLQTTNENLEQAADRGAGPRGSCESWPALHGSDLQFPHPTLPRPHPYPSPAGEGKQVWGRGRSRTGTARDLTSQCWLGCNESQENLICSKPSVGSAEDRGTSNGKRATADKRGFLEQRLQQQRQRRTAATDVHRFTQISPTTDGNSGRGFTRIDADFEWPPQQPNRSHGKSRKRHGGFYAHVTLGVNPRWSSGAKYSGSYLA
jgi:hypothetical protein